MSEITQSEGDQEIRNQSCPTPMIWQWTYTWPQLSIIPSVSALWLTTNFFGWAVCEQEWFTLQGIGSEFVCVLFGHAPWRHAGMNVSDPPAFSPSWNRVLNFSLLNTIFHIEINRLSNWKCFHFPHPHHVQDVVCWCDYLFLEILLRSNSKKQAFQF